MALDPLIAALTQSANQGRQQRFIFGEGTNTPDLQSLQRRRAMADQLINASLSRAPQTFGEGLTAIGQALAGRMQDKRIREQEESARAGASDAFSSTVGGASIGAPVPRSAGGMASQGGGMGGGGVRTSAIPRAESSQNIANDAMRAIGRDLTPKGQRYEEMAPYRDAIASIESAGSGDYEAVGPTHSRLGRALGRYQIMEANIGPWSQAALGREVTPDEFMQNPDIQDAIFNHRFGQYVDRHGPEAAAQAWFAGEGGIGQVGRRDSLGTSVGAYTQKFNNAMGGAQPQAPQQAGGMDATIVQLAQLAANPYLAPEKKAIVEALINQQMQGMDPMRQMQMEKAQLELEAMRNPQAQGYQQVFGRDLGLEGDAANTMFNIGPDGKISQIGGSGVNVSVNNRGNIPAGFQVITDPETGAERMEPIPGSPAAMDQEAAERGAVGRQAQRERAGGTVIQDLQRALDLIPELGPIASGEGVLGGIARQGIGPVPGSASIPGSVANRITQFTESALSNVGLDTLQQMRENSPTGGALGQVPIQQQQRLEQVLGSLNINQPPSELEANIKRVMNIYTDIIYGSAQERAMAVQEGRLSPQENAEIEQMYQELPFDERGRRREQQGQGGTDELNQLLMQDISNFTLEELREYNRRLEELSQ